jgi:hypothetical protein
MDIKRPYVKMTILYEEKSRSLENLVKSPDAV